MPGKLSLISTPRNLVVLTSLISVLSIFILGSMQGLELCLFLKIITFVLVTLRDGLFSLNQLEIKLSSLFKIFSSKTGSL